LVTIEGFAMTRQPTSSPEMEYDRLNPGGGPPGQQEERNSKKNPKTTRDDGGASIPGSQNADLKGPKRGRGPKGAST
jgi:hypothetical protein